MIENRQSVYKVFLFGKHSKRTPLSYSAYYPLTVGRFEFVNSPDEADFLIFGFSIDIKDQFQDILQIKARNPSVKLVVLSEEPLWDTLWTDQFLSRSGAVSSGEDVLAYTMLNHCTTGIYRFERFPYFVTTRNDYFVRYTNLFRRNAKLSADQILQIWQRAPIRQAYFAEKRVDVSFDMSVPEYDIIGLSKLRTEIALSAGDVGIERVGQGWAKTEQRQSLPDWHLDKLATLDQRVYMVSAIENTHHPEYITEKLFDAFAVLAIPFYIASPGHSVNRILPNTPFINLYGLTPKEASEKINAFEPTAEFMALYCEVQNQLADLFSSSTHLWTERKRIILEIVRELRKITK